MIFRDRAAPDTVQITQTRYGRLASIRTDRYIGRALATYGEYSESEVALWRQLLHPDAIVADVGANIGAHTVALAQLVPHGAVLAIEPLLFTYHILCANVALNGLTNVRPLHAAAGAETGTLTVPALDYTMDDNFGGYPLGGEMPAGNGVPLVCLDDLLERVDFVKVDVEGMEPQVLEGTSRLIVACHPILYVENNPGPHQDDLILVMKRLGYDLWWHYAPQYNPLNYFTAPAADPEILRTVSCNMLGLPSGPAHHIEGLVPIP